MFLGRLRCRARCRPAGGAPRSKPPWNPRGWTPILMPTATSELSAKPPIGRAFAGVAAGVHARQCRRWFLSLTGTRSSLPALKSAGTPRAPLVPCAPFRSLRVLGQPSHADVVSNRIRVGACAIGFRNDVLGIVWSTPRPLLPASTLCRLPGSLTTDPVSGRCAEVVECRSWSSLRPSTVRFTDEPTLAEQFGRGPRPVRPGGQFQLTLGRDGGVAVAVGKVTIGRGERPCRRGVGSASR